MRKPDKPLRILLDNNVYVSAIHDPERNTQSLQLIIEIIRNKEIKLIGNNYLLEEMSKYSKVYPSPTALLLLRALVSKIDLVSVEDRYIKICSNYISQTYAVDIIHAATCLQTDSILITNDKHFKKIKQEGIIKIWNIKKSLNEILK
ncbi:PIN domain-containing protein [Candidatus Bathyarchaeota archaeon]|jgi:predicted nucleic acid-binding protein|nr:PIN domain-containing protein [Candidatus Bathyarchaeota archaeon]